MGKARVLILRAPGANCDEETQFAFEQAGADKAERVHINRLREKPSLLDDFQVLVVPGGFTYGDDVAAGKILANQLSVFLGDQLRRFATAVQFHRARRRSDGAGCGAVWLRHERRAA